MKGREDNTDDRKRQGQHKRQNMNRQGQNRQGQDRQKCPHSAIFILS